MTREPTRVAILLADITGSTQLYQELGDETALKLIEECLDGLRAIVVKEGGSFINTKGDDVLSIFDSPPAALSAARKMLSRQKNSRPAIHLGIHFGDIIRGTGNVFGDAVIVTARLATMAKPGEVLMSQGFVEQLPARAAKSLRPLDQMPVKGKSEPLKVFTFMDGDTALRTQRASRHPAGQTRARLRQSAPEISVVLRCMGREWRVREGEQLTIGRNAECKLCLQRAWVSRKHATVVVRRGKVQLTDESTGGTYVALSDGYSFFIRRETVVLTGSGVVSPAMPVTDTNAVPISYEVRTENGAEERQGSAHSVA